MSASILLSTLPNWNRRLDDPAPHQRPQHPVPTPRWRSTESPVLVQGGSQLRGCWGARGCNGGGRSPSSGRKPPKDSALHGGWGEASRELWEVGGPRGTPFKAMIYHS